MNETPRFKLIFAKSTQFAGHEVTPMLMYLEKDRAQSAAQAITRASGLAIDVIAINTVHTTTVIANLNG